ncbi:MAG: hypothetical protein V1849_04650, partial [Chloroflexota bacterium]
HRVLPSLLRQTCSRLNISSSHYHIFSLAVQRSGTKRYITLLPRSKLESTCLKADEMLQL